ncbi:MAG TPA: SusC/RagA family TonB-linked outer membrane protein [Puia sp.]|nr:SusC/RagA family TonB-linked outer membrane protein [Puia sp.]
MFFNLREWRVPIPKRLLWIFCLFCATSLYAQTFSIPQKQATLREIFDAIHEQTGAYFSLSDEGILFKQPIPAGFKDMPLKVFLNERLPAYGLTYSFDPDDRRIILLRRKKGGRMARPENPGGLRRIEGIVMRSKPASGETEFLAGISVQIKGTDRSTMTDTLGGFFFTDVPADATLVVTAINMEKMEIAVTDSQIIIIRMNEKVLTLDTTVVNDGYKKRRRVTTTGSYNVVSGSLLERSTGSDALARTENLIPGVLDNHGSQAADKSSLPEGKVIHGRGTILADGNPLVIVDDFPYDGLLSSINPDDIESITILKDAAATAIWGARAGNGAIVITTKKGTSDRPRWDIHTSYSIQPRPDLWYAGSISSPDYIELEKYLYGKGYYDQNFSGTTNYAPVTPVIALLRAASQGLITAAEANARIEAMKGVDVRKDVKKYMYRNSLARQVSVQVSGKTSKLNYFGSAGWDDNTGNLVGLGYKRFTGRAQVTDTVSKRLQVYGGMSYTGSWNINGNNPGMDFQSGHGGKSFYPYYRLVDNTGRPRPFLGDYSPDYLRQTASIGFLPWTDDPVRDIREEKNTLSIQDHVLDLGLRYRLSRDLNLDLKYKVERQTTRGDDFHSDSSYLARDLINGYTQVDPVTGLLSYPIPPGGIRDLQNQVLTSQQGRIQFSYHKSRGDLHDVSILGGGEGRSMVTTASSSRLYGVHGKDAATNLDDSSLFMPYMFGEARQIPVMGGHSKQIDHFLSAYLDGTYTLRDRYLFSASGRVDAANLFGAETNAKGTPLWSVGGAWKLSKEEFFKVDWLSRLTLRASRGTAGNISRKSTAFTTVSSQANGITGMGYPTASIATLPNDRLRWELVRITNVGVDFATKQDILSGTVEYYQKRSTDLMAKVFTDPTFGGAPNPGERAFSYKNVAMTQGEGMDAELISHNFRGRLKWTTHFIFSYAVSRVTGYSLPNGLGKDYLASNLPNPVLNKPLYAVYSYKWQGLDPQTGDPRGISPDGKPSTAWAAINDSTPLAGMVYHGSAEPTVFGALRNEFALGAFSLSFNISYKFNYYFRKPALRYDNLLNTWTGPDSYARRWQKPGDEKVTSVPSLYYTVPERDRFYAYSAVNVARADNIRLEDVNLSYEKKDFTWRGIHCQDLVVFVYCSNLGPLWTANKDGINPYFVGVARDGKRWSIGLRASIF